MSSASSQGASNRGRTHRAYRSQKATRAPSRPGPHLDPHVVEEALPPERLGLLDGAVDDRRLHGGPSAGTGVVPKTRSDALATDALEERSVRFRGWSVGFPGD